MVTIPTFHGVLHINQLFLKVIFFLFKAKHLVISSYVFYIGNLLRGIMIYLIFAAVVLVIVKSFFIMHRGL